MSKFNRSKVTSGLHFSANKIREIGNSVLSNGKTVEDFFEVEGISFWRCAQPDMALHVLPPMLYKNVFNNFRILYLMLFLKSFKYKILEFKKIILGHFFFAGSVLDKKTWFLLASSQYIYRDTLHPLSLRLERKSIPVDNYGSLFQKSNKVNLFSNEWMIRIKHFLEIKKELDRLRRDFQNNELSKLYLLHPDIPPKALFLLFYWLGNVFAERNIINLINSVNCLKYNKPRVIISGDVADPLNRFFAEIAKKHNIQVLDIQFGVYDDTSVEWKFSIADKVIVWGKYFANLFHDVHNLEKGKIEILGSPRFDYLQNNTSLSKYNSSKTIKILFASVYTDISAYDNNYNIGLIQEFKKMVFKICKEYKDLIHLTIKPHPLEDISWVNDLGEHKSFCTILEKSVDIREHVAENDFFLTFGSTATFDALLLNRIILSANTPGLVWWDDLFLNEGVSLNIYSEEAFRNIILNYISANDEKMFEENKIRIREFLENKVSYSSETSSERIIRLVTSFS